MKISGVDIRPGNIIEYEGGIWRAVKIQHTQPGKGGAYMQVEMKNLIDGRKTNVRFRSAETVERVRLDTKDFQFLFHDGDMLTSGRPSWRGRRLPPGRHGRGDGALQRTPDQRSAARPGRSDHRRG
jgi:elongation factor P